ncbi:Acyl-protein thioesterase 1 protein [Oopsacas minuta]|uniref:palmitoyl-protein hydrolase n=1 Tax=Oopsacas minuta TaxID=111878 RepID=A0AAV7KJW6_9METZ|nr:Acyl-protein thioesterase 1 protein [Oopsacas minuta]
MAEFNEDSPIKSGFTKFEGGKSKIHCGIPAKSHHSGSIIFLHGLGDVGNTWIEYFKCIARDDINYVFPTATSMPVTVNNGHIMPSWFDTFQLIENPKNEDYGGIMKSCTFLESVIIEETQKGIPTDRIIIAGISQGGAITLITALTTKFKLGGVIILSSYLTLIQDISKLLTGVNRDTPLFYAHGVKDKLISIDWCNNTHKKIGKWFDKIHFKTYGELGHWVCEEEFNDIALWVDKVLLSLSNKEGTQS